MDEEIRQQAAMRMEDHFRRMGKYEAALMAVDNMLDDVTIDEDSNKSVYSIQSFIKKVLRPPELEPNMVKASPTSRAGKARAKADG